MIFLEKGEKMEKREMRRLRAPGIWIVMIAGALGILLLLVGSFSGSSGKKEDPTESDAPKLNSAEALEEYVKMLEGKIAALCEGVNGVSRVRVAVTLVSGYEYVYAKDSELHSNGESTSGSYHYLTIGSGSSETAVYLSEKPPTVGGIGIVCIGGGDPRVKKELIELLSAAIGVSSNKIYIAEGAAS